MIRPDYRDFKRYRQSLLEHSAKGSTWEDHKYIKRVDGTYYYPDSYEGGRHLPDNDKDDSSGGDKKLSQNDIESLAKEVIRGNFGNGQQRKDLLGENYAEVQKRVNELLAGSTGSTKVSEASDESIKKAEAAAKNASTGHSGVDMDKVLSVYRK